MVGDQFDADRSEIKSMTRPLVCIQGLGYVGAAMAISVANVFDENGMPVFEVIGLDLPTDQGKERVDKLNKGYFPFKTSDDDLVKSAKNCIENKNFHACTDAQVLSKADVVIVDVHLDIIEVEGSDIRADFSALNVAIETLSRYLRKGALVIVETTVPPGTCQNLIKKILSDGCIKRGMEPDDIHLAHSYERVMPGKNYLKSITNYWRVFAGFDRASARKCRSFLEKIINVQEFELRELSSMMASETAKIMENSFRAVNIAFIEEWSIFAEEKGLNMFEITEAIRDRPSHKNIRNPGLGVGGYCLTKDPLMGKVSSIIFDDKQTTSFPFSELAIETNRIMPSRNSTRIRGFFSELEKKNILVMGVAYKSDVDDTRNSPTEIIYKDLISHGAKIVLHDPFVSFWDELSVEVMNDLPPSHLFDGLIIAVPHSDYFELNFSNWIGDHKLKIFDCCNIICQEDSLNLVKNGCEISSTGIGR